VASCRFLPLVALLGTAVFWTATPIPANAATSPTCGAYVHDNVGLPVYIKTCFSWNSTTTFSTTYVKPDGGDLSGYTIWAMADTILNGGSMGSKTVDITATLVNGGEAVVSVPHSRPSGSYYSWGQTVFYYNPTGYYWWGEVVHSPTVAL